MDIGSSSVGNIGSSSVGNIGSSSVGNIGSSSVGNIGDTAVSGSGSSSSNDPIEIEEKGRKYWIPNVDSRPHKGQKFPSYEEALNFYKEYARKSGFETRIGCTKKIKGFEGYGRRYIVCNREGEKKKAAYDTLKNPNKGKRKRPSIRQKCGAFVRIKVLKNNMWEIYDVNEAHTHKFVNEQDQHFLKSQRRLTYLQKKVIHDLSSINIGSSTAFKYLKQSTGAFENVGATETDSKNFKRDMNEYLGERDADFVIENFSRKMECLEDFYFDYDIGSKGELTSLFWADEEAKRNYFAFGDVVGFDGTYRTNKYRMIFIPFTGIDNHKRCITFGAGLISSESIESYKWLLNNFKKAFGKEPNIIISDQDPAILQAVPAVFTTARHRLCMWHISQKFTEKLGTNLAKTDVLKQINDIIWNETIKKDEFESTWKKIMDEFALTGNKWFNDMYNMRNLWIPAYFNECSFSGLMRTTSRSEAENYFYGLLSNPDLHLVEFITHFETALQAQRCIQRKNDHESRYTNPDLKTHLNIEAEAAQLFTRNVFF